MYSLTDWVQRVDFDEMRSARLTRAREQLRDNDVDLLLAFKYENVRYVTGLRPLWFPVAMFRSAALAIPDDNTPVLCFVTIGDWEHRRSTMTWLEPENIRPLINYQLEEASTVKSGLQGVCDGVRELGAERGRIAVDQLTVPVLEALQAALPNATFVDANGMMHSARVTKTPDEITLFRMASEAVDQGMASGIEAVKPGRRECEVLGEVMRTFYSLGMEIPQCSLIVSSGENLSPLQRFAGDRAIRSGDLVFMDVGGCFNGMFAESTRVVVCGDPSPEQRGVYRAVHSAQQAVFKALRPGVSAAEISDLILDSYRASGMGAHAFAAPFGHSIGLAGVEPPVLGPAETMGRTAELSSDMTLSIEPTLVVPGIRGGATVRLEDEVVVTGDGCEVLTRTPYDERLLS